MRAEELIELADRTICQLFADTGGVPEARVWIHTKKRIITVPCKPRGPAEEGKMRAIICAMIYAARKTGVFEGAVMIAEAWMSIVKPPQKLSYSRPELDPNRIEVVILFAYGEDGKIEARARRIEHRNGKRAIGPNYELFSKDGMVCRSWMDAAFKEPTNARNGN